MDILQSVDWDVNQCCWAENISFGSGPSSMKPQILISAPAPANSHIKYYYGPRQYLFRLK